MKLKFYDSRQTIMQSLLDLSNKNLQQSKWINPNYPYSFWSNLANYIHVFFDDFGLEEKQEELIGIILIDEKECQVIRDLLNALKKVLAEIGVEQPDTAYINSPLWDEVVKRAQSAHTIFKYNDELYEKIRIEN